MEKQTAELSRTDVSLGYRTGDRRRAQLAPEGQSVAPELISQSHGANYNGPTDDAASVETQLYIGAYSSCTPHVNTFDLSCLDHSDKSRQHTSVSCVQRIRSHRRVLRRKHIEYHIALTMHRRHVLLSPCVSQ